MCSLACSQQEAGARWQGPGIPIRNVSFRLASKVPEHREGLTFLLEVTFEVRSKKWQPLSHGQKEKYSIATPNAAAPENSRAVLQKLNIGLLEAQRSRIHLTIQETWVPSLIQEYPTCHGPTKPMHHNYRACALEPGESQLMSPRTANTEAHIP